MSTETTTENKVPETVKELATSIDSYYVDHAFRYTKKEVVEQKIQAFINKQNEPIILALEPLRDLAIERGLVTTAESIANLLHKLKMEVPEAADETTKEATNENTDKTNIAAT